MRLALFVLCLCFVTLPVQADELEQLQSANRMLRIELEQARKSNVYFSFDLPQQQILIKVSGLTLATLPVNEIRSWGVTLTETIRTVTKKSAQQEPKREQIVIPPAEQPAKPPATPQPAATPAPEGEEATKPKTGFELQALELADMPRDYQLLFDDGLLLSVHGVEGEAPSTWERTWWYLSRPLISDWHFYKGKTYTEMRLIMPLREARMLYWSSTEGSICLFPQPRP